MINTFKESHNSFYFQSNQIYNPEIKPLKEQDNLNELEVEKML
jgi:hypothetical protein